MEVFSDSSENLLPLQWLKSFKVDYSNFIEICLQLFSILGGHRVDSVEFMEVFVDDGEIKVLHAVVHALEVHNFDVVQVQDEEGELTDRNETVLSRFDPDNLLAWATIEGKLFLWDFDL